MSDHDKAETHLIDKDQTIRRHRRDRRRQGDGLTGKGARGIGGRGTHSVLVLTGTMSVPAWVGAFGGDEQIGVVCRYQCHMLFEVASIQCA